MPYAKLDLDGAIATYPYDFAQFLADHPELPNDFAFGADAPDASSYGVVKVTEVDQPSTEEGQVLEEGAPQLVDGEWRQQWIVQTWLVIEPGTAYGRLVGDDLTFPYTADDLRRDLGDEAPGGALHQVDGEWGVIELAPGERPDPAPGMVIEEVAPEAVDGVWTRQWELRDASPEELAAAKALKWAQVLGRRDAALAAYAADFDNPPELAWPDYSTRVQDNALALRDAIAEAAAADLAALDITQGWPG